MTENGERLLMTQMLETAVRDYLDVPHDQWYEKIPNHRAAIRMQAHFDARRWIDAETGRERLPFSRVCTYLDLDPDVVRERLHRDGEAIVERFSDKRRAA